MTASQDKERVYGDPDLAWRVLGLLNVFRLLVPTDLYSVAALSASPRYLGSTLPWLFSATVVAMYVMGVLCIGMLKRRWPDLRLQAYFHIAFDVMALTALMLGQLAHAAGLPAGVLQVVPGSGQTIGDALVRHLYPRIRQHPLEGAPYAMADYGELRSLPDGNGGRRSMFGPDSLAPGSERLERFLLWPTGVVSPGAMRQSGRHAVAFVGERHFDDPFALGLDGQDCVAEAHPGMDRGHKPLAVGRTADVVQVVNLRIRVRPTLPCRQVNDRDAFAGVVAQRELLELAGEIHNGSPVRREARVAAVDGQPLAAGPVPVHDVHVPDLGLAFALVHDKADLRAVRRNVRVHFLHVGRPRQVGRL